MTFTNTSTAPAACPITSWLWNSGIRPSTFTNAQNPFHAFPSNNGSYVVVLTVTQLRGLGDDLHETVSL